MKVFLLPIVISFLTLLVPALAAPYDSNATSTTSGPDSTITTAPLTTLPSSSLITATNTPIIANVTTSIGTSGSATIIAFEPTFIVPTPRTPPKVAGEYKLRTKVLNQGKARFNHLYLGAWTLTNGFYADAAFTSNRTEAAKLYLNSTAEQLDFGGNSQYWSLTTGYDTLSSRWYSVSMHSPKSYGYGTFWLNGTGLQWTPNSSPPPHNGTLAALDGYFAGWMACDWWHGVPQLFYKVGGFSHPTVTPVGCADILLLPDYFD